MTFDFYEKKRRGIHHCVTISWNVLVGICRISDRLKNKIRTFPPWTRGNRLKMFIKNLLRVPFQAPDFNYFLKVSNSYSPGISLPGPIVSDSFYKLSIFCLLFSIVDPSAHSEATRKVPLTVLKCTTALGKFSISGNICVVLILKHSATSTILIPDLFWVLLIKGAIYEKTVVLLSVYTF